MSVRLEISPITHLVICWRVKSALAHFVLTRQLGRRTVTGWQGRLLIGTHWVTWAFHIAALFHTQHA